MTIMLHILAVFNGCFTAQYASDTILRKKMINIKYWYYGTWNDLGIAG